MPQPPDMSTVMHVIERAQMIYGEETADRLAETLAADWTASAAAGPAEQAIHAAAWQLARAAQLRALGNAGLANMIDHLAEACVSAWRQEVTVQTATMDDVP